MTNLNIGDKVEFDGTIGYIVAIMIDPIEHWNVREEIENPTYIIRVFNDWYKDNYFDFQRTEYDEIRKID